MQVELLYHTPEPEKLVAAAAKLCYSASDIPTLLDGLTEEKIDSFITRLSSYGHESPLEHISFTFGIEGVSRALTHQLVRHRIASYSQQSQRYVSAAQFDYVVPPAIAEIPEAKQLFLETMERDQAVYDRLAALLEDAEVQQAVARGEDEKKARKAAAKKAAEDARFVLPNAAASKIIVTMNARSLLNFFKHRCCTRAQWEIRDLASQMLMLVRAVAPRLFRYAGPPCLKGPCPEGTMSCGKRAEMQKKYLSE